MNRQKGLPVRQAGQAVLILILVMTVALAIGISVVQRSLSDISTASKVEQSSRAFSAAEAGIEDRLRGGSGNVNLTSNGSSAQVEGGDLIPCVPGSVGCAQGANTQQAPLEYPPLSKEEVAHIWLADYTSTSNPPAAAYKQTSLDVYWGNSTSDKAALELTLVYFDGTQYKTRKWYLDHTITRIPDNKFTQAVCTGYTVGVNIYQCKYTIGGSGDPGGALPSSPSILMLLRARLLYNSTSQPFAIQAAVTCPVAASDCRDYSIPSQARTLISTGISGATQRKVKLFQVNNVVPPYFDYGIFSAGAINK